MHFFLFLKRKMHVNSSCTTPSLCFPKKSSGGIRTQNLCTSGGQADAMTTAPRRRAKALNCLKIHKSNLNDALAVGIVYEEFISYY
jgi:hypothetical protein